MTDRCPFRKNAVSQFVRLPGNRTGISPTNLGMAAFSTGNVALLSQGPDTRPMPLTNAALANAARAGLAGFPPRHDLSPLFFDRPEVGRLPTSFSAFALRASADFAARSRKKYRGRAGRQGSNRTHGPRHLATSRLVVLLRAQGATQECIAASPPNPRRPARGVLGLLREDPRWSTA